MLKQNKVEPSPESTESSKQGFAAENNNNNAGSAKQVFGSWKHSGKFALPGAEKMEVGVGSIYLLGKL